jgi:chemotaxis protein MotB
MLSLFPRISRSGFGFQILPQTKVRIVHGAAFLALVVLFASLTGCVSADEHKRLQTAFEQSQEQLATAQNDLRTARARITELEGKVAELNRLLDTSSNGVGAILKERDMLQAQLADLQAKYNDLLKTAGSPALPQPVVSALRDLAAQYPDLLEFDERLGMVRLKSDLTFDLGSTEVRPQAKAALARVAQILNMPEIANHEVQVVGHTDDVPIRAGGPTAARNPDNWTLSTNRAWAVLAVLRAGGMKDDRGMASGWGDQRPIAPNAAGKRGNEKNRRVDIYIRPTTVPEGIVVSTPGAPAPAPRTPAGRGPASGRGNTPPRPTTAPGGIPLPM